MSERCWGEAATGHFKEEGVTQSELETYETVTSAGDDGVGGKARGCCCQSQDTRNCRSSRQLPGLHGTREGDPKAAGQRPLCRMPRPMSPRATPASPPAPLLSRSEPGIPPGRGPPVSCCGAGAGSTERPQGLRPAHQAKGALNLGEKENQPQHRLPAGHRGMARRLGMSAKYACK